MIINEVINARKLKYKNTAKGQFLAYTQYMHDIVRRGSVFRMNGPISVFWAVTDACNLNCRYCYAKDSNNHGNEMLLKDALALINELAAMGVCEIILEGGEPLLHKYILDIIKHIKSQGIILTILTNGTMLTYELAKKMFEILDYRYDTIQISLDGEEEVTDLQRGKGTYATVMKNLSTLNDKGLLWENLIVNCVITDTNYRSIAGMCEDLIKYTYVNKVHLSPVFDADTGFKVLKIDSEDAHKEYKKLIKQYEGQIEFGGYLLPDKSILSNREIWKEICYNNVALGCCAGRSKIYISSNGTCYPCTFLRSLEFKSGKYPENSIAQIWRSLDKCQYIRESYEISKSMTKHCTYLEYCALDRRRKEKRVND